MIIWVLCYCCCWLVAVEGFVEAELQLVEIGPYGIIGTNESAIWKRHFGDTIFQEPLFNVLTYYTINLTLGSNAEPVSVLIDTGSSDLWVPHRAVSRHNSFDPGYSNTWVRSTKAFVIQYVKGFAKGVWGRDTVGFLSGTSIPQQRFAVATECSDSQMGVFGIGPVNAESAHALYDNIPLSLVRYGYISKNVYSIYLNEMNSRTGTILFGGVDRAKYVPPLRTLPLLSSSSMKIQLEGIQVSRMGSTDTPTPAVLDTGTSLVYLPHDYVRFVAGCFGATYDDNAEMWVLAPSEFVRAPPYITFLFDGISIQVPKTEIFWPLGWFSSKGPSGYLGMTILSNKKSLGFNILGDTFLRSAYVVYDLDYRQVSIAQARNNVGASDILPIIEAVPGARGLDTSGTS
ncbi:hypothetical protein TRVA0_050S00166 [Trichomonascus vanleenenianus]|uniref:pepsin-like aspartic protease n=1 Tax=Trichomonascus vanleenenianus TaxID=2268995 RepID=UPI003ECB0774